MAGIYIHIPYCKKACHYCNFHFSTNLETKNDFVDALLHEIELQQNYLQYEKVQTIYFGGGTPSILSELELHSILEKIKSTFNLENDIEFTLEANPDDINEEKLINRLSIGVQSFFLEDLVYMNRAHSVLQAFDCIKLAKQCGISNISIDLIFGYPLLTNEKWKQNIDIAFALDIAHLSCYAMTIEPKTVLENMIAKKQEKPINPEHAATQFEYLMLAMQRQGYLHYEISNYAKPNHFARHNTNYWRGVSYLGLGPSAHSFNGIARQWNVANNALYIKSLQQNIVPYEEEILSFQSHFNEYVMIHLRMQEGILITDIAEKLAQPAFRQWLRVAQKFIKAELIAQSDSHFALTNKGKLFADAIAADLFI
jgi:oxygen-independent coproporphyrinogen III oxidase